jgi:hypothetical protein
MLSATHSIATGSQSIVDDQIYIYNIYTATTPKHPHTKLKDIISLSDACQNLNQVYNAAADWTHEDDDVHNACEGWDYHSARARAAWILEFESRTT